MVEENDRETRLMETGLNINMEKLNRNHIVTKEKSSIGLLKFTESTTANSEDIEARISQHIQETKDDHDEVLMKFKADLARPPGTPGYSTTDRAKYVETHRNRADRT